MRIVGRDSTTSPRSVDAGGTAGNSPTSRLVASKDHAFHTFSGAASQVTGQTSAVVTDCLFLAFTVLLSVALYVRSIGFYVDDWDTLSHMRLSADHSFFGLCQTLYLNSDGMKQRPIEIAYKVVLYMLFGMDPLGYHLVNTAVFLVATVLFYLALHELGQPRLLALAVPLVYALLPNYATDRFWYGVFQADLSMALYFLSLYADLRSLRHHFAHGPFWKTVSVLSLIVSGLAYEVALPLFVLNLALVWYRARQLYEPGPGTTLLRRHAFVLFATTLLALTAVIAFKLVATVHPGTHGAYGSYLVTLAGGAIRVNLVAYGFGLPYVLWWIAHHALDPARLGVALLFGLATFTYLLVVGRSTDDGKPHSPAYVRLMGVGAVVFVLGYAIFLTTDRIWVTSTGLGNRVAIGGAIGMAMVLVGLIGWFSGLGRLASRRPQSTALLLSLLCASNVLVFNTLASFWVAAYEREKAVIADIYTHYPSLPANSTFLLDGVCREIGGSPVFQTPWDLTGALALAYHDQTIHAGEVRSGLRIDRSGLRIQDDRIPRFYSYGSRLLLYNEITKQRYRLTDEAVARHYFAMNEPNRACSPGFAWSGQP
jgi:hypothetical protein